MIETLVAGYILRVAVRHNRWRISLHDIATHEVQVFASFKELSEHLEAVSTTLTRRSPSVPEQPE